MVPYIRFLVPTGYGRIKSGEVSNHKFIFFLSLLVATSFSVSLSKRYQETDTRDKKRNEELTEEFRRITKQYNDMQAKFRHFEISDNNRYEQVWQFPLLLYIDRLAPSSPPAKSNRNLYNLHCNLHTHARKHRNRPPPSHCLFCPGFPF